MTGQVERLGQVLAAQLERRQQRILKEWDERRVRRNPDGTFAGLAADKVDEDLSTGEQLVVDSRRARVLNSSKSNQEQNDG